MELVDRKPVKGQPVGPEGHWFWGHLRERNEDAVGFFRACSKKYGDFFRVRFGPIPVYIIARPDLAKEVLFVRHDEFQRKRVFDELSLLLGRGLITTEGERWRKHRRLMQPPFHMQSLQGFFDLMVRNTDDMMAAWPKSGATGAETKRNLVDDFMKLTLRIVAESLFGYDTADSADEISESVSWLLPQIFFQLEVLPIIRSLPTKNKREFNRRREKLDRIIFAIIEKRRQSGENRHDLLGMLMAAVDEEDKSKMSNEDLRDEVMTMFMAGHETTANGLSWTMHLLGQHPEVEAKIREELARVVGDAPLKLEHLRELTYMRSVFEEAIRLYPPVWAIPRTSLKATTLAGYDIPKGAVVSVNPYLLHRRSDTFPDPERFDPDRFSPEKRKTMDRYAFLPFGAGPHICIGQQFAMMEVQIILAQLLRRYAFTRPADEPPVTTHATITLRPTPGVFRFVEVLT